MLSKLWGSLEHLLAMAVARFSAHNDVAGEHAGSQPLIANEDVA